MNAGQLDQRVSIERQVSTQDEIGQPINAWLPIVSCWASVLPISGREYFAAAAMQASVTTRVTMRFRPGITAADRIKHGDKVYGIESVIDHRSARRELVLMCRG